MSRIRGYKFKYYNYIAYGITMDNEWLFASFTVDNENFVLTEVVPVQIKDFFNGDAISQVEQICDELAENIYGFWSQYHDKINVSDSEKIKVKLFEKNPCDEI